MNLCEQMHNETAAIQAEIEFSNDVFMAQRMFQLYNEGLDPSHMGHGHPLREKIFQMYVEQGSPVLTGRNIELLFH